LYSRASWIYPEENGRKSAELPTEIPPQPSVPSGLAVPA